MTDYSTRNIIDYAADDNGVELRKALYAQIHDKVNAHIEAARQAVGQTMVKAEQDELDIEVQDTADTPIEK